MYRRYDTGEPHPLDGGKTYIVGYVDPVTRWQMYRLDEDAAQPESTGVRGRRACVLRPGGGETAARSLGRRG
eukprot:6030423-Pleurochrysis_carterae.AAC.1